MELLLAYASEKALQLDQDQRKELEKLLNSILAVVGNKDKGGTGPKKPASQSQGSHEESKDPTTGGSTPSSQGNRAKPRNVGRLGDVLSNSQVQQIAANDLHPLSPEYQSLGSVPNSGQQSYTQYIPSPGQP